MADFPRWHETFSGSVVAFVGEAGGEGVYVWQDGRRWVFHPANSRRWDALHQQVFRNGRAVPLTSEMLEARSIPAPPHGPPIGARPITWAEQFEVEMPVDEVQAGLLPRLSRGAQTLWVILYEDLFETTAGDGKYLYPAAAFWSPEEARLWVATAPQSLSEPGKPTTGYRLTLKVVSLSVANGRLKAELTVDRHEHCSVRDVLRRLERPMRFEDGRLRG